MKISVNMECLNLSSRKVVYYMFAIYCLFSACGIEVENDKNLHIRVEEILNIIDQHQYLYVLPFVECENCKQRAKEIIEYLDKSEVLVVLPVASKKSAKLYYTSDNDNLIFVDYRVMRDSQLVNVKNISKIYKIIDKTKFVFLNEYDIMKEELYLAIDSARIVETKVLDKDFNRIGISKLFSSKNSVLIGSHKDDPNKKRVIDVLNWYTNDNNYYFDISDFPGTVPFKGLFGVIQDMDSLQIMYSDGLIRANANGEIDYKSFRPGPFGGAGTPYLSYNKFHYIRKLKKYVFMLVGDYAILDNEGRPKKNNVYISIFDDNLKHVESLAIDFDVLNIGDAVYSQTVFFSSWNDTTNELAITTNFSENIYVYNLKGKINHVRNLNVFEKLNQQTHYTVSSKHISGLQGLSNTGDFMSVIFRFKDESYLYQFSKEESRSHLFKLPDADCYPSEWGNEIWIVKRDNSSLIAQKLGL